MSKRAGLLPPKQNRFLPPAATGADDSEPCHTCDSLKRMNDVRAELKQRRRQRQAAGESADDEVDGKQLPPGLFKIGRAGWTTMHTIAAYYPDSPTAAQVQAARAFLDSLAVLFPCETCASDFTDYIAQHPPQLDSRQHFSLWACEAHNAVNEKLGKEQFPCDQVLARWRIDDGL